MFTFDMIGEPRAANKLIRSVLITKLTFVVVMVIIRMAVVRQAFFISEASLSADIFINSQGFQYVSNEFKA